MFSPNQTAEGPGQWQQVFHTVDWEEREKKGRI